jgi:hypothetical protein
MYDDLIRKVMKLQAEFSLQLTMAFDPYRLSYILAGYQAKILELEKEAKQMVEELENG